MEEIIKFGGGMDASSVSPISLLALVVTVLLILLRRRRDIIVPVLCFVILIPVGQQFYIGGVHLFFNRIVILVGLIRAMSSMRRTGDQFLVGGWNSIDTAFSLYVLIQTVAFSLQYMQFDAVINQIGFIWDALGGYFLMRVLITDIQDIDRALKCVSYIFVLLAVDMLIEQIYMTNLFVHVGGQPTPEMRDGSIRSIGPFRHALTVGNIAATTMPLFMFLWYRSRRRAVAVLGIIASTIMVITAHSSGPLLAYAASVIALLFWPMRRQMRLVRWAAAFSLVALHLVMKAPVWFLIARIDLTGSSSSYHRANLMDQFIKHFSDWWLIGVPNQGSWGWSLWDVQNQYVSVGVEGGLAALTCFIAVIIYGFSMIGKARKSIEDERQERCLWVLGASLFSYMIAFFGVNFFDQSRVLWVMFLAIISASTASVLSAPKNPNSGTCLNYA